MVLSKFIIQFSSFNLIINIILVYLFFILRNIITYKSILAFLIERSKYSIIKLQI